MKNSLYETQVVECLNKGLSGVETAKIVGCSGSTVSRYARKFGFSEKEYARSDWKDIAEYYASGHSYLECKDKLNVSKKVLWTGARRGFLNPRPADGSSKKKTLNQMINDYNGVSGSGARQVIRRKIIEENALDYHCALCGIDTWREKPLTLRLDHINGDGGNHSLDNLRFICPNCDSQTDTYCSKNRGRYKNKSESHH